MVYTVIVYVEKEKIIKTSLIILFSFFLLIVTTYFINENLAFSQQNKYEDPKSVNEENAMFIEWK